MAQRRPQTLRLLLEREEVLELEINPERAAQFRQLEQTPGWQHYLMRLEEVTDQAHQWVLDAETESEFRFRRGFLAGHLKTRQILEVLISQSEIGDREWAQQQMEKLVDQSRQSLLLTGQGLGHQVEKGQTAEPLERVERLRQFLGLEDLIGRSSQRSSKE